MVASRAMRLVETRLASPTRVRWLLLSEEGTSRTRLRAGIVMEAMRPMSKKRRIVNVRTARWKLRLEVCCGLLIDLVDTSSVLKAEAGIL